MRNGTREGRRARKASSVSVRNSRRTQWASIWPIGRLWQNEDWGLFCRLDAVPFADAAWDTALLRALPTGVRWQDLPPLLDRFAYWIGDRSVGQIRQPEAVSRNILEIKHLWRLVRGTGQLRRIPSRRSRGAGGVYVAARWRQCCRPAFRFLNWPVRKQLLTVFMPRRRQAGRDDESWNSPGL
jgi:hypothetical protein